MAKWIEFKEVETAGRKTRIWAVMTTSELDPSSLGYIRWFGRWRGYAFYPDPGTLYEATCLNDIAAFIKEQNAAHREAKKKEAKVENLCPNA
jgi:hypothetical protein